MASSGVYDNSPSNQASVNGVQKDPTDVVWGDGTFDEMCLNYLIVDYPYIASSTGQCADFPECVESCDESDTTCYLGCVVNTESDCQSCLVSETTNCSRRSCPNQLGSLGTCLDSCDEGLFACLSGACSSQMDELYGCIRPELLSGTCNSDLQACGAAF